MSTDQPPSEQPKKGVRRQPIHGVEYVTADTIASLEKWLEANCRGKWSIGLADMDEKRVKKTVRILFAEAEDKQRFVANFARR